MTRTLSALLLALGLLFTGACSSDQTGDSNTDNQIDEVPGDDADKAEQSPTP
ncbi:MAG: hypothetical protein WD794_16530 [Mycobacteriales bacterium]